MISSSVGEMLSIAKEHMSMGTLRGAVASASLAADVSLLSKLQAGD